HEYEMIPTLAPHFNYFLFQDTATTEIYTLSLHDALPIYIRELEGALTKITAYAKLYKTDITLEVAENALRDLISPNESDDIEPEDRKSTRLNSSHVSISYAVFCLIKKKSTTLQPTSLNRT